VAPISLGRAILPLAGEHRYFRLRGEGQSRLIWSVGGHVGPVSKLSWSADGRVFLSTGADEAVRVWRSADGSLLHGFPAEDPEACRYTRGGALSPDGTLAAVVCWTGALPQNEFGERTVRLYRTRDGQRVATFYLPFEFSGEPAFSPDGGYVYCSSGNPAGWQGSLFRLNDATSHLGELLRAFVPDGQHFLGCGGQLVVLPDGPAVRDFGTHTDCAWPAAFTPDSGMLADGAGADVRVWQMSDGTLLRTLRGRTAATVTVAVFSPTGQQILTRTSDNAIHLWQISNGTWLWSQNQISLAVFSPDGRRVWTLGTDGRVRTWRVSDGSLVGSTTEAFSHQVAVFSPDGTRLLTGGSTGTLALWDVSDATGP
jgi:WD40 repeat protein